MKTFAEGCSRSERLYGIPFSVFPQFLLAQVLSLFLLLFHVI